MYTISMNHKVEFAKSVLCQLVHVDAEQNFGYWVNIQTNQVYQVMQD